MIAAALGVQTQLSFPFGHLNITVVLVYYYGLKTLENDNPREFHGARLELRGALFGVLVGLAEDTISGHVLGPYFLSKGLIGFLTPLLFMDVIFKWTPLWAGIIIAVFTVMDGVIVIGAGMIFSEFNVNTASAVQETLFQVLLNVPLGMLLKAGKHD